MHGDCFDAFVSRHVRFGELCSDVFAYCQRRLAPHHRGRWRRLDALSAELSSRDRSAVYGGFHVYARAVH